MSDTRKNPDALLAAIHKSEQAAQRGRLKVFLGMSAGVGKTYAMLEAAHRAKRDGRDVVIGYVESHGRRETDALCAGLPLIPRRTAEHRGLRVEEMDLDAILKRRPELVLVDELAHTNAPGSRHPKRWQDVVELLESGLDVVTTLNIQHVESRTDTVRQITGSTIYETVPDRVLDEAEVEVVDLPPEELMARLEAGKVYSADRAEAALFHFFREGNLKALREMALRYTAGRVGRDVQDYLQAMQLDGPWKSGERLLVGVSGSPTSAALVRRARSLAESMQCPWIATHVDSPVVGATADDPGLERNLAMARELGAEVIRTVDEDRAAGLLRIARQHNATHLVVGKPGGTGWTRFLGTLRLNRLLRQSGAIDVLVVHPEIAATSSKSAPAGSVGTEIRPEVRFQDRTTAEQYGTAIGVVAAISFAGGLLAPWIGDRAIALLYLLGVVSLALVLGRGPILFAAAASAVLWDYFFLPPRFTLYITRVDDGIMFGLYFVVAAVLGHLVTRLQAAREANRRREERATALYLLTRDLASAVDAEAVVRGLASQIGTLFQAQSAVHLPGSPGRLEPAAMTGSTYAPGEKELGVAEWAHQHGEAAGRFTANLPLAESMHLPLRVGSRSLGVLSIRVDSEQTLQPDQRDLLDAFARQAALMLERQQLQAAEVESRQLAESERLGRALLNSISHEIRTPLAVITAAAAGLRSTPGLADSASTLAGEIYEATDRLNRLVRNLLNMARMEAGHVAPQWEWVDPVDVARTALRNCEPVLRNHAVEWKVANGLPLIRVDPVLIGQVLENLLMNAAVHASGGGPITLSGWVRDGQVALEVSDRGPGIPASDLERIFDKFWRARNAPAGGTGLGLSIARGFAEACGGRLTASARPGGGTTFSLQLPVQLAPVPPEAPIGAPGS